MLLGLVNERTRLITMPHVSNVTGAVAPVAEVVAAARRVGARLLLDCCQSAPHMPLDVRSLGADWVVASGHKMCGPTGIGFLWGKRSLPTISYSCARCGSLQQHSFECYLNTRGFSCVSTCSVACKQPWPLLRSQARFPGSCSLTSPGSTACSTSP